MSRMNVEKLVFVGEQVGLNEYEAQCTLAEDCDVSGGVLRPRRDDTQISPQPAQRACMVDVGGGTLRLKNSPGYCFAFGDDAYFPNDNGQWVWVKPNGTEQMLYEPGAPAIIHLVPNYSEAGLGDAGGTWNPPPNNSWPPWWSNISGSLSFTFTFTNAKSWKGAAYLWVPIEVPPDADPTFSFYVNGTQTPGRFIRADNSFGWLIWDVRGVDCSSVASIGFSYTLDSSHTLRVRYYLTAEYSVPVGVQSYTVTLERNGIESILSTPKHIHLRRPLPFVDSCGVVAIVDPPGGSGWAGDIIRLYRAVEGQYVEVARFTATGAYSSANLYDKGDDTGEFYRPSGKLPYGPAVVVGNRVAIAAGRTLWISQAGNPIRFVAVAINDDNQDAYTIILPATIHAIVPGEGGVVAHTRSGQYFVPLNPQFDNDKVHLRQPTLIDDRAASSFKAAAPGAFISDGRLFVDGQLIASGLRNNAWVVRAGGRVYVIDNYGAEDWCFVWSQQEWQGALRWIMPGQVNWAFSYGDDVYICTNNGSYQIGSYYRRKSSCRWISGKRFAPALGAIRFIHIAGTARAVRVLRPNKPTVSVLNVSGRVNVPSQEQTHEWALQIEVARDDAVYQCFVTTETGVQ